MSRTCMNCSRRPAKKKWGVFCTKTCAARYAIGIHDGYEWCEVHGHWYEDYEDGPGCYMCDKRGELEDLRQEAKARVNASARLSEYRDILLEDWYDEGIDHFRWVVVADESVLVAWAREILEGAEEEE